MKTLHRKIRGGGTKLLVLVLLFSVFLTLPVFAEEVGDSISYTSRNGQRRFFANGGWKGGCAEFGVDAADSGTARVTATYAYNSDIAKLLYRYGVQGDWFDNNDAVVVGGSVRPKRDDDWGAHLGEGWKCGHGQQENNQNPFH